MANSLHILIVDDRPDSVLGLMDLLTAEHHRVEIQENSMEALSLLARKQTGADPFHLVILDVNMPILDGPGLLRELRRRGDKVPAAYVTGYQSVVSRIQQEGTAYGLLAILTKPPDIHAVRALLAKVAPSRSGGVANDEAFFGTGRIQRSFAAPEKSTPSDGALARARVDDRDKAAPLDFDAVLEARNQRQGGGVRTPVRQQPVLPVTPTGQPLQIAPLPESHGIRRIRTPDPSAYYGPDGTSLRLPDSTSPTDPMATLRRDPVTGSYARKPSGIFPPEPNAAAGTPGTTTTIRRSVAAPRPGEVGPPGAGAPPLTPPGQPRQLTPQPGQPSTGTVRLRRSLSGHLGGPPADPPRREVPQSKVATPVVVPAPPTRVVACAHCAGVFQVLVHPQPYAVQCVHCGQLNRIDPA